MLKRRLPGPLARRLTIALLTGVMLLLSVYGYFDYRNHQQQWRDAAEQQASAYLDLVALGVARDLQAGNHAAVDEIVKQLVELGQSTDAGEGLVPGVRGIELRDRSGTRVAHYGEPQNPAISTEAPAALSVRWLGEAGTRLGVSGAVLYAGRNVGDLYIEFDTSPLYHFFKHPFGGRSIYLPAALCAVLLLTLLFAHWLMYPLRHAIAVLPRIGDGSVNLPALTTRRDDYAELGRAIEFADRRIHEANRQLQAQQNELVDAQAELNRFKNTLDQTLDCVFMFAPHNLRFFYTNAGALRQVGYSAAELKKMTVLDIKPEFDEPRFRELLEPLVSGARDSITFETVHKHKDGSLIPVEIFLQYITPADEAPRFVALVRDISERKRVDQELEQHRQHLEELVEARSAKIREQVNIINQTHDSVVTTDLDGFVTSWNGGAERMFGIDADAAIGRHISFVYPQDQHEFLQYQVIDPVQKTGEHETEVRMRRDDGSEFFAHLSLSMLHDDSGTPRGMVGYSVDITERKRREALLQNATSRLQASNQELESFCYTVSHDLRAPLRTIHGFSELLGEDYEDKLDATGRDYLRRIQRGAENMGRIIDDLLELSRVSRCEVQFREVDMSELAGRVVSGLREREPQREVDVAIEPGLLARGDEGLLHIMLENLLGNAWKYTGQKTQARIEFGTRPGPQEPVFYIKDNGAGFDMRYVDKLFGTFERLHQTTEFPGTGIGLATVHRIVERHGGSIRGEGQPGEGACFYFSLPQQAPQAPARQSA